VTTGGTIATVGTSAAGATSSGGVNAGGTVATAGTSAGGTTSSGGVNAGGTVATAGTSAGGTTTGSSTSSGYNPCPPTGSECVVLPLGDSITAGFGSTSPGGGYRLEIFRQAVADNKNIRFVGALKSGPVTLAGKTFPQNHEGHGGYNIDSSVGGAGIAGDITNRAMTNYTPHIVLLMIGTNDINGNVDPANAPNRLKNLVNSIITASSTTLVVVSSILPLENTADQKVKTYNSGVKSVVDELAGSGKHVVFLDNYAIFTADTSFRTKWMYDSIHPNDTGYDVLGQSWYGAIGPLLR
jgi:lysophospholipase L1-like esterase